MTKNPIHVTFCDEFGPLHLILSDNSRARACQRVWNPTSKFAPAIAKAAVWANTHQKESAAILVANSKLDPATAATMARAVYGTQLDASLISPVIDAAVKYGIIAQPARRAI